MNEFLEILKYILPSIVVALVTYYIIKEFLQRQLLILEKELKLKNRESSRPAVIQSYERLVLFLERISPGNMIMRVSRPEYTSIQLQGILLQTIRSEFDHNLSQQLFISGTAWGLIKQAKEDTIRIINTSSSKVNFDANGSELAAEIFETIAKEKRSSVEDALNYLKKEVKQHL